MVKFRKSLPPDWLEGHDGGLACPHRNMSVCDACTKGPHAHQVIDVFGVHFWVASAAERDELTVALATAQAVIDA